MPELERWVLHRLAELDEEVLEGLRAPTTSSACSRRCSSSPPSTSRPSTSTSARTRSTATRRPARAAAPPAPCSTRSSTASSPGSRRCCPSPWRRSGSPASPARTARSTSSTSPTTPRDWHDAALAAKWDGIRRARRVVTGALEVERRDKRIGASLEAAPIVHVADDALRAALASIDFADVCITSDLTLSRRPRARRRLHPRRRPRRRRGPDARRRREVRPLLEDPPRRRHPRPPRRLRPLRRGARLNAHRARPLASHNERVKLVARLRQRDRHRPDRPGDSRPRHPEPRQCRHCRPSGGASPGWRCMGFRTIFSATFARRRSRDPVRVRRAADRDCRQPSPASRCCGTRTESSTTPAGRTGSGRVRRCLPTPSVHPCRARSRRSSARRPSDRPRVIVR